MHGCTASSSTVDLASPLADDAGWLVLVGPEDQRVLAFQLVEQLPRSTWPHPGVPVQLHLDLTVETRADLEGNHRRALSLGATELLDRTADPDEALHVYADPAGHPFCVFVA